MDTIDEAPTYEVPVPKYNVGDVIWRAHTRREKAKLDCPDCLGSQLWECTTPGGTTLTVPCQRCGDTWRRDDFPSLVYTEHVAVAAPMTIRSIEIRAGALGAWGREAVTYYDNGGCCGIAVPESAAIATEEEARAIAQLKADEANAEDAATPERLKQAHYSKVTFRDAAVKQARDDVWEAWWAYRHLFEDCESLVREDACNCDTPTEKLDTLRWNLDHEKRSKVTREFIVAMDAVLERALQEFPPEMFLNVPDVLKARFPREKEANDG